MYPLGMGLVLYRREDSRNLQGIRKDWSYSRIFILLDIKHNQLPKSLLWLIYSSPKGRI